VAFQPANFLVLIVFTFTYLLSFGIYLLVINLAKGKRADAFKVISAGMLPPLGILFGLFVAFTAAQVWDDTEKANSASYFIKNSDGPLPYYYYFLVILQYIFILPKQLYMHTSLFL
jgi:hypothetical protein